MRYRVRLIIWVIFQAMATIAAQEDEQDGDLDNLEQSGANYLQNVMDKLQQEREEGQSIEIMELTNILNMDRASTTDQQKTATTMTISGPTPVPPTGLRPPEVPPVAALTSDELKSIYNAAIMHGATLPQSQSAQNFQTNAKPQQVVQPAYQGVAGENAPGYYYYFYPIKSFLTNPQGSGSSTSAPGGLTPPPVDHTPLMSEQSKAVEPLFMAVTGFIGMALMFIVSVLFLPKLGIRSSNLPELKEAPEELAVFGKLVIESMDGKDCTERLACEVGRFVRTMRMVKLFKILEIVLPPNTARQIGLIRKAAAKKEKCNFIPCRFRTSRPPAKTNGKPKPWEKGPTPHDLWMKNFEKEKKADKKKPSSVWNKKT